MKDKRKADQGARGMMPISDREIWACANHILIHHSEGAALYAAQRADALLAQGDMEGRRTWLRILKCIGALEARPSTSDTLN